MGIIWTSAPWSTSCTTSLVGLETLADISEYIDAVAGTKDFAFSFSDLMSTYSDPHNKCITFCVLEQVPQTVTQCAVNNADCVCDQYKTAYYVKYDYTTAAPDWEYGWAQEIMGSDGEMQCRDDDFNDISQNRAYSIGGYCYCGAIDNVYQTWSQVSSEITVNVNPSAIYENDVRFRCALQNKNDGYMSGSTTTNTFKVTVSCDPSASTDLVSTTDDQIYEDGSDCSWSVKSSGACTKSIAGIKAYKYMFLTADVVSGSTTVTDVTNASNDFILSGSTWQFTGLTSSGSQDEADLKFYGKVTYDDGTTSWLSPTQLSLYCDPCENNDLEIKTAYNSASKEIVLEQGQGDYIFSDFNSDVDLYQSTSCDIYNYAFSDSEHTIPWSDSDVVLSAADTIKPESLRGGSTAISEQTLTIKTDAAIKKEIFIKGYNSGKNAATGTIEVVVCGNEQITLTDSTTHQIVQDKYPVYSYANRWIGVSGLNLWFTETEGANSHEDCFDLKNYILCAEEPVNGLCPNEWGSTDATLLDRIKLNQYPWYSIRYNLQQPFSGTVYYLRTWNGGATSAYRKITLEVCGLETVSLDTAKCSVEPSLNFTYEAYSNEIGYVNTQVLDFTSFDCYTSSSTNCPISSSTYELVQDVTESSGTVTAFSSNTNSFLSMNSTNFVELLTTASFNTTTYYIRIFTSSTSDLYANNIFLPLTLEVFECTEHNIELVDPDTKIELSFLQNTATPIYQSLSDLFQISHGSCIITSFGIDKVTSSGSIVTANWISFGESDVTSDDDYFGNMAITSTVNAGEYLIFVWASNGPVQSDSSSYLISLSIVAPAVVFEVNIPPSFDTELTSSVELDLGSSTSTSIAIPDFSDFNGDEVSISVSGPEFATYDEVTNMINIANVTDGDVGEYTIEVSLSDGIMTTTQTIDITIGRTEEETASVALQGLGFQGVDVNAIDNQNLEEETQEIQAQEEEVQHPKLMARIIDISTFGDVSVKFSEETKLALDQMQLELQPFDIPEGFNMSKLNFTWEAKSFDGVNLEIKINFTDPVYVSPNSQQDRLLIRFQNVTNITSVATLESLDESSWVLFSNIKKQIPDNEATKNFAESTEKFDKLLKVTFYCAIALNIFMSGSSAMSYFIEMLNSLQIVIHFPMFRMLLPGNVTMFFKLIIPIVMFDILDGLDDTKYDPNNAIEFDENNDLDTQKFISQMSDLGYKTNNSVQNLGSMFFILLIYFIRVALIGFFYLGVKYSGKGKEQLRKERNRLFFNDLGLLVVEGYMELAISGYINYLGAKDSEVAGEIISDYTRYFCFASVFLIAPGLLAHMLTQDIETIKSDEFQESYGVLNEGVKTSSKWTLAYYMVFIVRRFAFCFIAFGLNDINFLQIFLLYLCNLLCGLYSGYFAPKLLISVNRLERLNEFLIQFCSVCLFFFTDYIPDPETQYNYGFILISLMTLLMLSNLAVTFKEAAGSIFLVLKKYYNRIKPRPQPEVEVEIVTPPVEAPKILPNRLKLSSIIEESEQESSIEETKNQTIEPLAPEPLITLAPEPLKYDVIIAPLKEIERPFVRQHCEIPTKPKPQENIEQKDLSSFLDQAFNQQNVPKMSRIKNINKAPKSVNMDKYYQKKYVPKTSRHYEKFKDIPKKPKKPKKNEMLEISDYIQQ